jgi:tripartite-type tricarboxylate transporter receptor subunit TctC
MTRLNHRSATASAFVISALLGVFAPGAAAQEPFYKGKRLSLLINFGAGSSTDTEARLFGRHFAKHIDGQPESYA